MNAGTEFLRVIDGRTLAAAVVSFGYLGDEDSTEYRLPVNFTPEQFNAFVDNLNRHNYDNGYGMQKLFGTIWFANGTWASRGEYDGSEWWEVNARPAIPAELFINESLNF